MNLLVGPTGSCFDTTRKFLGAPIKAWRSSSTDTLYTHSMGTCECGRPWNQHEAAFGYCPWPKPEVQA